MRQIVSEYALTHSELSLAVKCFLNPFDMLDEMGKSGTPDIALLDICMPGILYTELAIPAHLFLHKPAITAW